MPEKSTHIIMSPPDFYNLEYSINPWMDLNNKVDQQQAMSQWLTLKKTYESLGYSVKIIDPKKGLPDLTFTTDHIKKIANFYIASRFRHEQRQLEQAYIIPWYQDNGYQITQLPPDHYMEGGDVLQLGDIVYLGHGFRSSANTAKFIQNLTGITTKLILLTDGHFYHLDTCFLPLANNTAFYYPDAFDKNSRKILESEINNIIPFTKEEVNHFAANSVLMDKTVIHQKVPKSFTNKLHQLGYKTIELDMSEFTKSGGGIHCLSQINDSRH